MPKLVPLVLAASPPAAGGDASTLSRTESVSEIGSFGCIVRRRAGSRLRVEAPQALYNLLTLVRNQTISGEVQG